VNELGRHAALAFPLNLTPRVIVSMTKVHDDRCLGKSYARRGSVIWLAYEDQC
jgi:hypothetical protein